MLQPALSEDLPPLSVLLEAPLARARCRPETAVRSEELLHSWLVPVTTAEALPDGFLWVLADNAVSYQRWQEGGVDGTQAGFLALHARCIRLAGDVDRGTEIASETYLDIRARLEEAAARAADRQKWLDFRHPDPDGRQNVDRYHRIQARFRAHGKWRRRHTFEHLEEEMFEGVQHEAATARAEAETYSLPLHFAAQWYRADAIGNRKGAQWWWTVLLHSLRLIELDSLGGARNDPAEALLRLQVRLAAAQGANRWVRRQVQGLPYWQQLRFGLPDADSPLAPGLIEVLSELRPALSEGISALSASPAEKAALVRVLVQGKTARNQLRTFDGESTSTRRERMMGLAEEAGRLASLSLLRGKGAGGGGDSHRKARTLMRQLDDGAVVPTSALVTFQAHIRDCPDCMSAWVARCEAPAYLDAGLSPTSPPPRRRMWIGLAAVAVAAIVIVPRLAPDSPTGIRGDPSGAAVHMELSVQPAGSAEAVRFDRTAAYSVGDRVFFLMSADTGQAPAVLWVDGPAGVEPIDAALSLTTTPSWLPHSDGLLHYSFDAPGRYTFYASPTAVGDCPEARCVSHVVEVR